jgi:hypothetical protein
MVRDLAKALDDRLPEKAQLLALIERVYKAPANRHGYAHRPWIEQGGKLYQLDMPAVPIQDSAKHPVTTQQMDADCALLRRLNDDLNEFQRGFGNKYLLPLERRAESPEPWPGKWPGHTPRRKK